MFAIRSKLWDVDGVQQTMLRKHVCLWNWKGFLILIVFNWTICCSKEHVFIAFNKWPDNVFLNLENMLPGHLLKTGITCFVQHDIPISHLQPGQVRPCKLHVAGTSCTDYSLRGEGLQECGKTRKPFQSWCGMRNDLEEDEVLHENVPGFEEKELHVHLGHRYHIDSVILNPSSFGFPVERPRKWTIMRHKLKTKAWKCPWNLFTTIFQAKPLLGFSFSDARPLWDVWFCASDQDLWKEFVWASSRPESRANGTNGAPLKWKSFQDFKQALETPESSGELRDEISRCLTTVESGFLANYRALAPGMAYSLNQNPEFTATDSTFTALHTLIKNAGVIWTLGWWNLTRCSIKKIQIKSFLCELELLTSCWFQVFTINDRRMNSKPMPLWFPQVWFAWKMADKPRSVACPVLPSVSGADERQGLVFFRHAWNLSRWRLQENCYDWTGRQCNACHGMRTGLVVCFNSIRVRRNKADVRKHAQFGATIVCQHVAPTQFSLSIQMQRVTLLQSD